MQLPTVPVHLKRLGWLVGICGGLALSSLWLADGREADRAVTVCWSNRVTFLVSVVLMLSDEFDTPSHIRPKVTLNLHNTLLLTTIPSVTIIMFTIGLIQMTSLRTSLLAWGLCLLGIRELTQQHYKDQTQRVLHGASLLLAAGAFIPNTTLGPESNLLVCALVILAFLSGMIAHNHQTMEIDSSITVLQIMQMCSPHLCSMSGMFDLFTWIFATNFQDERSLTWGHCAACILTAAFALMALYGCLQSVHARLTTDFVVALSLAYSLRCSLVDLDPVRSMVAVFLASLAGLCAVAGQWGLDTEQKQVGDDPVTDTGEVV